MHNRKFTPQILARATGAADVAELCSWQLSDLFAAVEDRLLSLVGSLGFSSVRSELIESMRRGDGSPHICAEEDGSPVGVYVLCISSVQATAALSRLQYDWVCAHPGAHVFVLPCVVQRVSATSARCVTEKLSVLRAGGKWAAAEETRQFLPPGIAPACFLGSGGLLKKHTLVREVVNAGIRIYPYVEGLAHNGDMPQHMQLLTSGEESPMLLVLTEGARGGAVRLRYADFYSCDNPVNELEVYKITPPQELQLMDSRGGIYRVVCAEQLMFGHCMKMGMHMRWAVSLVASSYTAGGDGISALSQSSELSTCINSVVQSVSAVQFCGLPGYCLQVRVNDKLPQMLFNVYVFAHQAEGRVPKVGDAFMAEGILYAVPDSLVEAGVCWADSPITAAAVIQDKRELAAARFAYRTTPLSLHLAAIGQALLQAGCRFEEEFDPVFRFGRPEFRVLDSRGQRLLVMVDTVTNGMEDTRGYRRRFHPDRYPAHMKNMPQGGGSANILFITAFVSAIAGSVTDYNVKWEFHGFNMTPELPARLSHRVPGLPLRAPITEADAARFFARCMGTQCFESLLPYLREDVYYRSETASLEVFSKSDMLRHLRGCFDNWAQHNELPNISFVTASVLYKGVRKTCTIARQSGELISATIFTVEGAFITGAESLAPEHFSDIEE